MGVCELDTVTYVCVVVLQDGIAMPLAVAVLCYVIRTMRLMVRVVHGRLWLHQTPWIMHLITPVVASTHTHR